MAGVCCHLLGDSAGRLFGALSAPVTPAQEAVQNGIGRAERRKKCDLQERNKNPRERERSGPQGLIMRVSVARSGFISWKGQRRRKGPAWG